MTMWVETPDDPLELVNEKGQPLHELCFSSNMSREAVAEFSVINRTAKNVSFQVTFLGKQAASFELVRPSTQYQQLHPKRRTTVVVKRAKGDVKNEQVLLEHLIIPDDYNDLTRCWERARIRKIEPWHQLIPMVHTGGKPDKGKENQGEPEKSRKRHQPDTDEGTAVAQQPKPDKKDNDNSGSTGKASSLTTQTGTASSTAANEVAKEALQESGNSATSAAKTASGSPSSLKPKAPKEKKEKVKKKKKKKLDRARSNDSTASSVSGGSPASKTGSKGKESKKNPFVEVAKAVQAGKKSLKI